MTVASNAPSSVTNTATVSGGGQSNTTNDSASDVTTITTTVATPISLVQHAGKDAGTTTSATLAFPSANTAGNWVAVAIRAGITGQTFTVTDTRANTYRRAVQLNETVDQTTVAIFYAENIAGGTNTVTVSDSLTGSTLRFAIFEYAGVAATNSLDGVATAQGTGTVPNSGSATTTMSGELAIGMIATANPTIFTAGNGFIIEEARPASPNTKLIVEDRILATAGLVAASGSLASSDLWSASVATFRPRSAGTQTSADLTLTKSHSGSFAQGQTGATYSLTVRNGGTATTVGTVTVTDTLPAGLTATAMSGTGWNCTQPAGPCTRADSLAAGASYPSITLTVTVASNAPSSVTNTATVSGGGQSNTTNDSASDVTTITTTVATPISLVQHAGKDAGTTTSATLAFPSANTAGNWVAVAIRAGITGQTFTVTDTRANTYRRAVQLNETVDQTTVAIFYAENIAGGTNTVTVSDSLTGSTLRLAIFEYAGVAATNSLDGVATAQGTGTVPNSGSATTTMSGELAIGMIATANPTIFTAGNGFIIEEARTSVAEYKTDRRGPDSGDRRAGGCERKLGQ